jgi:mannan endo-1,4-beta-mannosidase
VKITLTLALLTALTSPGLLMGMALAETLNIEPANPNASEDTRKVLKWLYGLPHRRVHRIVSGHLAGGSIGPTAPKDQTGGYEFKMDEINYLHEISGKWVGLIGADYCAGWIRCPDPIEATMYYKDVNRALIDYWNAGGLVVITTHQFDPRMLYKGGGYHRYIDWPPEKRLDIARLYTPGTEEYRNFRIIMDRWAEGLGELQRHGVVVIWRPYNEATNSSKWWCRQPAEKFKKLYRYTFRYLTYEKGLNNLLWVYDAVDKSRKALNMSHYPGDEYVDIVGITMNWDSGPAAQPEHPYPRKVFAVVEFNVRWDKRKYAWSDTPRNYDYTAKFNWMKRYLPYASYFMSWDRMSGPYAIGTPESVRSMLNDPIICNRGDIDWKGAFSGEPP